MNGNQSGIAIERNVFVAEEASQATILRQLLGRADSNTILRIHQPKFVGYLKHQFNVVCGEEDGFVHLAT